MSEFSAVGHDAGRNRHTVAFTFWGYTEEAPEHQEEHRDLDRPSAR